MLAPLFLPGDRLDRLPKAIASGADALILDLEDGVAAANKESARNAISALVPPTLPILVRINASGSTWYEEDLAMVLGLGWAALLLSKLESKKDVASCARGTWALIETAKGLANVREIAATGVAGLLFGSIDYSADIGCAHEREPLLAARCEIVLASRLAGLGGPIDGVTPSINDLARVEEDARYSAGLGFSGKLCIHPHQVGAVHRGLAPSEADLAWAQAVLDAKDDGAVAMSGVMVDEPVRIRARQIVRRSGVRVRLEQEGSPAR
jgi:citrate lyase subunit beta/citryl-CoA lyase